MHLIDHELQAPVVAAAIKPYFLWSRSQWFSCNYKSMISENVDLLPDSALRNDKLRFRFNTVVNWTEKFLDSELMITF